MVFHQVILWRTQFGFGQDTSLYAPIAIVLAVYNNEPTSNQSAFELLLCES